jgi:hypothetical protein
VGGPWDCRSLQVAIYRVRHAFRADSVLCTWARRVTMPRRSRNATSPISFLGACSKAIILHLRHSRWRLSRPAPLVPYNNALMLRAYRVTLLSLLFKSETELAIVRHVSSVMLNIFGNLPKFTGELSSTPLLIERALRQRITATATSSAARRSRQRRTGLTGGDRRQPGETAQEGRQLAPDESAPECLGQVRCFPRSHWRP